MMNEEGKVLVQRIRFTGARTRLASIVVRGFGRVFADQIIEVPAEDADRYTTLLPSRNGDVSDFEPVGGQYYLDPSELVERRSEQRAASIASENGIVVEPEMASAPVDAPAHEQAVEDASDEQSDDVVADEPSKKGRQKRE